LAEIAARIWFRSAFGVGVSNMYGMATWGRAMAVVAKTEMAMMMATEGSRSRDSSISGLAIRLSHSRKTASRTRPPIR